MLQKTHLNRVFNYSGMELPDPDITLSPIEVRDLFAATGSPELGTAEVRGPEVVGDRMVYTFHRAVGTKGAELTALADIDQALQGYQQENQVSALPPSESKAVLALYTPNARSNDGLPMASTFIPWVF